MFFGKMLALFPGPKLQENLHNNDIGNEIYICCEIATMTNEGKNKIHVGKTKTFQITKTNTSCRTKNVHLIMVMTRQVILYC
jgi:hypothetical protein